MSTIDTTPEILLTHDSNDAEKSRFGFEPHYGLASKNARDVLHEILEDMSCHTHVHNWDDKLTIRPLVTLAGRARSYLNASSPDLDTLLADTVVDEVLTVNGVNCRPSAGQEGNAVDSHLFFVKSSSKKDIPSIPILLDAIAAATSADDPAGDENIMGKPSFAQGRIVYIKERVPPLRRAGLLILHSFCIRLQNEDYGFIRTFIERHLSLKFIQKIPYHWQQTSPPELNSSRQMCYKRVTISCHITYLTLNSYGTLTEEDIIDRAVILPFQHEKGENKINGLYLFKSSSSVLLTLAVPEISASREEETRLLRTPEALWTVLVVNCPSNFAFDNGPPEHLTPIAQFIRGIASALGNQRINTQIIYEETRDRLKRHEGNSLFDDEHFTKSTLYHWAVKVCDELSESISSSLRFIRKSLENQMRKLSDESHKYEKLGVDYWMQQTEEEMLALEDLQSQITALRTQVQENRNALHGITAILEARLAVQQGDRMKTLAYLATVYLPLTTTASLYSMSVLPTSATLPSTFVVFALLLLLTITLVLGLNLPNARASLPVRKPTLSLKRPGWTKIDYIQGYVDILNPTIDLDSSLSSPSDSWGDAVLEYPPFKICWYIFRRFPVLALHHFLANEVNFPFYQWFLYQHRHNERMKIVYHWAFFVRDFIRFPLIPVWFALGGVVVFYLVLQDVLGLFCIPVLKFLLPISVIPFSYYVLAVPVIFIGGLVVLCVRTIMEKIL